MSEPITQAQDHDRRLGRLEGIAEQLDRQLDDIKQGQSTGFADMGRRIDATNARIDATNARIDALTRWLIGIQIASLIALGTLILSRLPG